MAAFPRAGTLCRALPTPSTCRGSWRPSCALGPTRRGSDTYEERAACVGRRLDRDRHGARRPRRHDRSRGPPRAAEPGMWRNPILPKRDPPLGPGLHAMPATGGDAVEQAVGRRNTWSDQTGWRSGGDDRRGRGGLDGRDRAGGFGRRTGTTSWSPARRLRASSSQRHGKGALVVRPDVTCWVSPRTPPTGRAAGALDLASDRTVAGLATLGRQPEIRSRRETISSSCAMDGPPR